MNLKEKYIGHDCFFDVVVLMGKTAHTLYRRGTILGVIESGFIVLPTPLDGWDNNNIALEDKRVKVIEYRD